MARRPNRLPNYDDDTTEIEGNLKIIDLDNDGTDLPVIDLKVTPSSANVGTMMQLEADGSNWSTGSRILNIISDDNQAIPIFITNGTSEVIRLERSGNIDIAGNLQLNAGGNVVTTNNGSLTLLPNGSGITIVGDAGSTSHSLATNDDLFVSGKLEVDGTIFFDGNSAFYASTNIVDNIDFVFGSSSDSMIRYSTAQTIDSLMFGLSADSNIIIFCETADRIFNFAHAQQTNPTVFIHSANRATDEWIGLTHDQTNAKIESGKGALILGNATCVPVMPTLTTTERNALTAINGMIIYNSTTTKLEAYSNGSWQEVGDIT